MWGWVLGTVTWPAFWCGFCSSKLNSGISELARPATLKTNSKHRLRLNLQACGQTGPQTALGFISQRLFSLWPAPLLGAPSLLPVAWLPATVLLDTFFVFDLFGGRKKKEKRRLRIPHVPAWGYRSTLAEIHETSHCSEWDLPCGFWCWFITLSND